MKEVKLATSCKHRLSWFVADLTDPLECDRHNVRPVTFQLLSLLYKHFPWALYKMET